MKYLARFILLFAFILTSIQLSAVPAYPYPVTIIQPDGTQITILLRGDEHFHFKTTSDGYPIIKSTNGFYNYAKIDNSGNFTDSKVKVSNVEKRTATEAAFLAQLPKDFVKKTNTTLMRKVKSAVAGTSTSSSFPTTGSIKSIVILVNFSDTAFVTPSPNTAFTNLLNQEGYSTNGGTGSARDYFVDNSMGVFQPGFDVYGPYTLPHTMAYYGANDAKKEDVKPTEMIADACKAADAAGVDFSQYDANNDGYIDNVFVYYAGYNEAEHGPENSIWPHRWVVDQDNYSGTTASITFDGKILYDYACTSELRGSSGSNMCGIGTFCHEFGHVLGLVDFYATDDGTQQTLSYWDIMDAGPYLNSGRTPPSYSSHERFYLGWLTPIVLNSSVSITLDPLNTSNTAYMITQTGTSNLDGEDPNPTQYFMLENRQKTGWDTYLPGHGMLISRIHYNAINWYNNEANNTASDMGDDIMEADGKASDYNLSGDPFPGTSDVTSYTPVLVNGTVLSNYPITDIAEADGVITFNFMGGTTNINPPVALEASDITYQNFVANWKDTTGLAKGYYLSVYTKNGNTNNYALDNIWVTDTSYTVNNLVSDKEYYYVVKASNRTSLTSYETISNKSNEISVHTNEYSAQPVKYTKLTPLRAVVESGGNTLIFVPKIGSTLKVYDITGRLVGSDVCNEDIYEIPSANISRLIKGQIYILKYEDSLTKLLIAR